MAVSYPPELWDSAELRARRAGIDTRQMSESLEMLVSMGYQFCVRSIQERINPETRSRTFFITHEVYEWVPIADNTIVAFGRGSKNVIRTEVRKVTIHDDPSAPTDTITYS
jgi:hypothetical protein